MNESSLTESSQWGWWFGVVLAVQIGILWWLSKPSAIPTKSEQMSVVRIEDNDLLVQMSLEDPVGLIYPNIHGHSEIWLKPQPFEHQLARWVPPYISLPKESNTVDAIIGIELDRHILPRFRAYEKLSPRLTHVTVPVVRMENSSTLKIQGEISQRSLREPVVLKSDWENGEFLSASRVQVLVDPRGRVVNGILVQSSRLKEADQMAMKISLNTLSFQEVTNKVMMSGELIFRWHTNPNSITNLTERFNQ